MMKLRSGNILNKHTTTYHDDENTNNNDNNPLVGCSSDILHLISSYLHAQDVLNIKQSCRSMCYTLMKHVSIVQDLHKQQTKDWIDSMHWIAGGGHLGDSPRFWQYIPLSFKETQSSTTTNDVQNIHSIRLKGKWHDQGWGNLKGRIVIMKHKKNHIIEKQNGQTLMLYSPSTTTSTYSPPSNKLKPLATSGDVVYMSPIVAPHTIQNFSFEVNLSSQTEFSDMYDYSIWVIVGGGGGHELYITDFSMSSALMYNKSLA